MKMSAEKSNTLQGSAVCVRDAQTSECIVWAQKTQKKKKKIKRTYSTFWSILPSTAPIKGHQSGSLVIIRMFYLAQVLPDALSGATLPNLFGLGTDTRTALTRRLGFLFERPALIPRIWIRDFLMAVNLKFKQASSNAYLFTPIMLNLYYVS